MISQTDAALAPLTPNPTQPQQQTLNINATVNNDTRSNNNNSPNSVAIHNGKVAKGGGFANVKKRKKFDETVIDGFAIIAFKTWEDLQDELNDRNSISNNNSIICNSGTNFDTTTNTTTTKCTTDATSTSKKANSKSKSKSSSNHHHQLANSDAPSLSSASTLITSASFNTSVGNKEVTSSSNNSKKKDKAKKGAGHHQSSNKASKDQSTKDKRNKTSSEKNTLKRALEAKELAEKRLSILQEKLEREQSKNRNLDQKTTSITATTNVQAEHYAGHQTISPHIVAPCKEEKPQQQPPPQQQQHLHHSSKANGMLGQVPIKDLNQAPKPMPYSPFHINPHIHRQDPTMIHNHMQIHQASLIPSSPPRIHQQNSISHNSTQQSQQPHQHPTKHSTHLINQHKSTPPPPLTPLHHQPTMPSHLCQQSMPAQPPSHLLQQTPPPPSQSSVHQPHPYYTLKHPPQFTAPQQPTHPNPHAHLLQQHQTSLQSPMNPYSHQPSSSIMSSMGLGSLPSPYSCPPSIYITDTISRQTSIIPPPSLEPALEQSNPQTPGNRFGHSSVLHSITPYTPPVPTPHHPMYYPTLPTERSFIEFARSYTGPGHLGYSNLMNSFPTSSPSTTANPYSFDRWPRMALDQRAVSRYNSLYQSTTILPDRTYTNYTTTRAPTFPAGLFPPPF